MNKLYLIFIVLMIAVFWTLLICIVSAGEVEDFERLEPKYNSEVEVVMRMPDDQICQECNKRKATGSIGSLIDSDWIQYICSECYDEMGFKPLWEMAQDELRSLWDNMEVDANIVIGSGNLNEIL